MSSYRWLLPILSGACFLLVVVVLVGAAARHDRALEWCGLDRITPRNDRIRDVHTDWTWRPPGWDCVYTDTGGHEVGRRRATPP